MNETTDHIPTGAIQDLIRRDAARAQHPNDYEYAAVLGARLRAERERQSLSPLQLALRTGVGDRWIELLELGLLHIDEVDDLSIESLAEGLQIDPNAIFYGPAGAPGAVERVRQWLEERGAQIAGTLGIDGRWVADPAIAAATLRGPTRSAKVEPTVEIIPRNGGRVEVVIDLGRSQRKKLALLVASRLDNPNVTEEIAVIELDGRGRGMTSVPNQIPSLGPLSTAVLGVGLMNAPEEKGE